MAVDDRKRYHIEPANYQSLKLLQAFAVIDGNDSPDLSILINRAIRIMVEITIEELRNDGNKYHAGFAEKLEEQLS